LGGVKRKGGGFVAPKRTAPGLKEATVKATCAVRYIYNVIYTKDRKKAQDISGRSVGFRKEQSDTVGHGG